MAENIINQFLEVKNASNWTETKQNEVDANGQIVFIPGDVNSIYAKGKNYGDGALSSKTLLTEEITIEGGPLASDAVKKAFKNGVIPAGTDLQDLLKSLLCVEIWSTGIQEFTGKLTLSQTAATISGMKTGFVEVGTQYTTTAKGNDVTINLTQSYVNGFDNSYYYSGNTKIKTTSGKVTTSGNDFAYVIEGDKYFGVSLTDYNINDKKTGTISESNIAIGTTKSLTAYTAPGTNTLSVVTHYSYCSSYTLNALSDIYDCSNLGAKGETEYKTDSVSYTTKIIVGDKTDTKTFTGAYPIYFNGTKYADSNSDGVEIDTTNVAASDAMIKSNELFSGSKDLFVKFPKQDANSWKIAIPEYYSGATISAKAFDGLVTKKYSIDVTFSKTSTTGYAYCGTNNNVKYTYYIWEATGSSGANGVKLTFNLKS